MQQKQYNRKIKILYIEAAAGGGAVIALYEMIKQLDLDLVEPVVICYFKNPFTAILETIKGCRVIFLSQKLSVKIPEQKKYHKLFGFFVAQTNALKKYYFTNKALVLNIKKIILIEKPDIIHQNDDIITNRESLRAGAKTRIPQVQHLRSMASYGNNYVNYFFDYFLVRKAILRVNITEAVQAHFNQMFHLSDSTSFVLHDFVDREKFQPTSEPHYIRKEFKIDQKDFLITSIGRIIPWKGQQVLIEALNSIKDKIKDFKVLIVGPYEKGVGDINFYNKLLQLIDQYQLHQHIIFTGNRADIPEILNASDIIVHTSVKPEPQGLVVIEGLLCKKPVIASDAGGARELIIKYGGFLFEPGNEIELGKTIERLYLTRNNEIQYDYPLQYEKLIAYFNPENQREQLMKKYAQIGIKYNKESIAV